MNKQQIYALLERESIPFTRLEHPAVYTMEEMDRAGIATKGTVCKNLFLRDAKGKNHFLVTVSEETKVDLKLLAERLPSSRLSFASPERLEKYLGLYPGSVSPLGLLHDESRSVVFVLDKKLSGCSELGVHPCENTATVWLSADDLLRLIEKHGNPVRLMDFDE